MSKAHKDSAITGQHIGNLVAEIMKQRGINKAELARRLHRNYSTTAALLRQPSLQVYVLWELSLALSHDFFETLSQAVQAKAAPQNIFPNPTDKNILAALKKELAAVKEERDLWRRVVGMGK